MTWRRQAAISGGTGAGGRRPSAGVPANNPVAQHPLIAFFVIAYAVAWSFWPFASFSAFGPLVAALIVIPLAGAGPGSRNGD